MSDAIRVKNLSKRYRIGLIEKKKDTIGATIISSIKKPFSNFRRLRSLSRFGIEEDAKDILWALRDVSFTVPNGQVLGIIGRNGAGKSTLLKVLSRITHPTGGRIEVAGRISCLLEVGTGFHPELTGRDNIYLNGTILGMSKREIDQKLEEIVDFSGIEKFIETPIKRYSSGMKVRLAFSVAAHLEPEILIIDEVLAVGDAGFQKKCINKMEDVGKEGRTVLFVSHNMPAITRLCDRVLLLEDGRITDDGEADKVVSRYLSAGVGIHAEKMWDAADAPQNKIVRARAARVLSEAGSKTDTLDIRKPVSVELEWEVLEGGHRITPAVKFGNEEGLALFTSFDMDPQWRRKERLPGWYRSRVSVPGNYFAEGMIIVDIGFITESPFVIHCSSQQTVAFTVYDSLEGNSARGDFGTKMAGVVRPMLPWQTDYSQNGLDLRSTNGSGAEITQRSGTRA
jgi:lipopolysaccharide transport system ATP-binding protein